MRQAVADGGSLYSAAADRLAARRSPTQPANQAPAPATAAVH